MSSERWPLRLQTTEQILRNIAKACGVLVRRFRKPPKGATHTGKTLQIEDRGDEDFVYRLVGGVSELLVTPHTMRRSVDYGRGQTYSLPFEQADPLMKIRVSSVDLSSSLCVWLVREMLGSESAMSVYQDFGLDLEPHTFLKATRELVALELLVWRHGSLSPACLSM